MSQEYTPVMIAVHGMVEPLTDELIRKEIQPVMEFIGNPFDDDLEESIAETKRLVNESWKGIIDSNELSELISEALMNVGCYQEARYHLSKRFGEQCKGMREMKSFMERMDDIAFESAEDVAIKRENANINGETPMGVMLRLGSETAK